MDERTLAETLRHAHQDAGLSIGDVAVLASTTPARIASYEAGLETPYPRTLVKLAAVLQLDPEAVLSMRLAEPRRRYDLRQPD